MKENLSTIIEMLITSTKKTSRKLSRGLILAYTPGSENDDVYRFTCSRRGVSPSDKEMAIIERDLKAVLRKLERPFVDMRCQPWLRSGEFQYHLWEWRELKQGTLFGGES